MKECLWCKKEYEPKKDTSKFCSTSCRVMYNRKYGKKNQVTAIQVQVLYNAFLEAIGKIQYVAHKETYDSPKKAYMQDEPMDLVEPRKQLPKVAIEAIKRKYVEDRRECSCDEEYLGWVKRLEIDQRLSNRDKQEIKNTP